MAAQGTVTINIVGDVSRLRGALGEAETGLAGFSSRMQSVGDRLTTIGTRMTLAVTLPLALLGKRAFDAASDLEESLSKVNVVFGDNARAIRQWSRDAATAMGISRQEALEAAGTFGNLFRALGLSIEPATDMSQVLVQLASDLASFNNADPEEVLIALRSGLVGEVEPLRKFGVSLSAARVEAKAFEMGLADANGELSDSAKVQARYAIILEDTTLAQGDFARTADGAANKQRTMRAQFTDTIAVLGKSLLPIFQKVAEAIRKVAEWFSNLDPRLQQFIVYAGIAAAAIGPIAGALGALITVIAAIATPVGLIVVAIAAVVAAIVLMWMKWDEIWNFIKEHPAIGIVVGILAAPVAALFLIIGAVKFLYENWSTIWPAIRGVLETVWGAIQPIIASIRILIDGVSNAASFLGQHVGGWFQGFIDAAHALWNAAAGPLGFLLDRLREIISVANAVKNALNIGPGGIGDLERITGGVRPGPGSGQGYGPRAAGGPVLAGGMYLVGEQGPELFSPSRSGHIIPNHALGGSTVQVHIDARHLSPDEVAEAFHRWARRNGVTV